MVWVLAIPGIEVATDQAPRHTCWNYACHRALCFILRNLLPSIAIYSFLTGFLVCVSLIFFLIFTLFLEAKKICCGQSKWMRTKLFFFLKPLNNEFEPNEWNFPRHVFKLKLSKRKLWIHCWSSLIKITTAILMDCADSPCAPFFNLQDIALHALWYSNLIHETEFTVLLGCKTC